MYRFSNSALAVPALILAFAILLAATPAWAKGDLPGEFYGKFRGAVAAPGNASGNFSVEIEDRKDGFSVRWQPRISVNFEPAGRPGVFRDSKAGQPMSGDPLYWARMDSGRLIVYSMQLDEHGGYDINSYIYAPNGKGLDLSIRRIKVGGDPVEFTGRLERYGG